MATNLLFVARALIIMFFLIERFRELDGTVFAFASTSSGRIAIADVDAIRARREKAAREGREGRRPRRPARSSGTVLCRRVRWAAAKESDRYKEGHQLSFVGRSVLIVS